MGFQLPSLLEGQHSLDGDMVGGEPLVGSATRGLTGLSSGRLEHAGIVKGVGAVEDIVIPASRGWLRSLKPRLEHFESCSRSYEVYRRNKKQRPTDTESYNWDPSTSLFSKE